MGGPTKHISFLCPQNDTSLPETQTTTPPLTWQATSKAVHVNAISVNENDTINVSAHKL